MEKVLETYESISEKFNEPTFDLPTSTNHTVTLEAFYNIGTMAKTVRLAVST